MVNITVVVIVSLMVTVMVLLVKNWNLGNALDNQQNDFAFSEKSMMEEHKRDVSRINTVNAELNTLKENINTLQLRLTETDKVRRNLEIDAKTREEEVKRLNEENVQLKNDLQTQIHAADTKAKQLSEREQQMKNEQETIQGKLGEYEQRLRENEVKLQTKEDEHRERLQEIEKLRGEIGILRQQRQTAAGSAPVLDEPKREVKRSVSQTSTTSIKPKTDETNIPQNQTTSENREADHLLKLENVLEEEAADEDNQDEETEPLDSGKPDPRREKEAQEQPEEGNEEEEIELNEEKNDTQNDQEMNEGKNDQQNDQELNEEKNTKNVQELNEEKNDQELNEEKNDRNNDQNADDENDENDEEGPSYTIYRHKSFKGAQEPSSSSSTPIRAPAVRAR